MTPPRAGLERSYRRLLKCYPASWRRKHEEAMLAVLLDQADATGRSTVSTRTAVDLIGSAAEERLEAVLRWIPTRLRAQIASTALAVAAGLSLLMVVGELVGAHYRPGPDESGTVVFPYLHSGPFLTIGVPLYLAFLVALFLVGLRRGSVARVLIVLSVGYAAWLQLGGALAGLPGPRTPALALFLGLGVLAGLATLRPTRAGSRRLVSYAGGFVLAVVAALAVSKPVLDWSVGTMATSGNVALAALAIALPMVGGAAILVAAVTHARHPGWAAAIAIAAFPVVIFCTLISQAVNPVHTVERAFIPAYYAITVAAVALIFRRRLRRLRRLAVAH